MLNWCWCDFYCWDLDIPGFLEQCGHPIHPCGLSLRSMCEHRLLPLTEDSLPCEDLSSPLGGPHLDPATLEGEGPPGSQKEPCAGSCPENWPSRCPPDWEWVGQLVFMPEQQARWLGIAEAEGALGSPLPLCPTTSCWRLRVWAWWVWKNKRRFLWLKSESSGRVGPRV